MVRKATEERNGAAKEKLLDIMTESFRKLADKANESAMLEEKIEAMKDMIANLRQSIAVKYFSLLHIYSYLVTTTNSFIVVVLSRAVG